MGRQACEDEFGAEVEFSGFVMMIEKADRRRAGLRAQGSTNGMTI